MKTHQGFFKQLGLLAGLVAFVLFLLDFIPYLQEYRNLSFSVWLVFVLLSLAMYFASYKAAQNDNPNHFHLVVIGIIFSKMVFALLFIVIFVKMVHPATFGFLIPFFFVYLSFSIFEYYFMINLGKIEKKL